MFRDAIEPNPAAYRGSATAVCQPCDFVCGDQSATTDANGANLARVDEATKVAFADGEELCHLENRPWCLGWASVFRGGV